MKQLFFLQQNQGTEKYFRYRYVIQGQQVGSAMVRLLEKQPLNGETSLQFFHCLVRLPKIFPAVNDSATTETGTRGSRLTFRLHFHVSRGISNTPLSRVICPLLLRSKCPLNSEMVPDRVRHVCFQRHFKQSEPRVRTAVTCTVSILICGGEAYFN